MSCLQAKTLSASHLRFELAKLISPSAQPHSRLACLVPLKKLPTAQFEEPLCGNFSSSRFAQTLAGYGASHYLKWKSRGLNWQPRLVYALSLNVSGETESDCAEGCLFMFEISDNSWVLWMLAPYQLCYWIVNYR